MIGSRRRREAELTRREEFRRVRRLAAEDVTALGESLAELDDGTAPSGATAPHWQQALDGYERAKLALDAADAPADLDRVARLVGEARYQRACLVALHRGEPLPARRDDCFFNPQHGPAMTDVAWTPPGGVEREIEVCHSCARRLGDGEPPDHRQVHIGDRYVAWWEVRTTGVDHRTGARAHVHGDRTTSQTDASLAEAYVRATNSGPNGVGSIWG